MECAECERDLRGGHAPDCSRRCQVLDDPDGRQCERRAEHKGTHGIYGEGDGDGFVRTWPAFLGEPSRPWSPPEHEYLKG